MEKLIPLAQVEQLIDGLYNSIDKETPGSAIMTRWLAKSKLSILKSKLSSLPTEESGWIAVSPETMPEEWEDVLITDWIYFRVAGIWSDWDWYDSTSWLTYEIKQYNQWKYISLPKPPLQ